MFIISLVRKCLSSYKGCKRQAMPDFASQFWNIIMQIFGPKVRNSELLSDRFDNVVCSVLFSVYLNDIPV